MRALEAEKAKIFLIFFKFISIEYCDIFDLVLNYASDQLFLYWRGPFSFMHIIFVSLIHRNIISLFSYRWVISLFNISCLLLNDGLVS